MIVLHCFDLNLKLLVYNDRVDSHFFVRIDEQHHQYVFQVVPKYNNKNIRWRQFCFSVTYFSKVRLTSSKRWLIRCSARSRSVTSWLLVENICVRSSSTNDRERESAVERARAVSLSNVRRTTCCSLNIRSIRCANPDICENRKYQQFSISTKYVYF